MLRQILEITLMNLRNVNSRRGASSVIVVGIAGVVAVLIGLLSMAAGFSAAMKDSSRPDRAIVMRAGSSDELDSWLANDEMNVITQLPGIAIASGEIYVALDLPKRATRKTATVVGRGVQAEAFAVRPELHIVEGARSRLVTTKCSSALPLRANTSGSKWAIGSSCANSRGPSSATSKPTAAPPSRKCGWTSPQRSRYSAAAAR